MSQESGWNEVMGEYMTRNKPGCITPGCTKPGCPFAYCLARMDLSAGMNTVFQRMVKISQSHETTLILGETGTGKELMARCIHEMGQLREKPFLSVDCSSLAPPLLESELFGYVRGAFTGAVTNKKGLFEEARE